MEESKLYVSSPLNWQSVQSGTNIKNDNFQNSQNLFNLFDADKSGDLDETEINYFFNLVDDSDGQMDYSISTEVLTKYSQNSNFDENMQKELVDFTNQIYSLTQSQDANAVIYQSIEPESDNKAESADGKIDNFKQSAATGDCWLLAQIEAISQTSEGEVLIHNSIKTDDNGNYLVSFDGVGENIQISSEEMQQALASGKYSSGDADTVLLEIAMEKYLNQQDTNDADIQQKIKFAEDYTSQGKGNGYNILNNNSITGKTSIQYVLTGDGGKTYSSNTVVNPASSGPGVINFEGYNITSVENTSTDSYQKLLLQKAQDSSSMALVCILKVPDSENGNKGLFNNHAYSVEATINQDGDVIVSLTNPQNTANKIYLTYDEFSNTVMQMGIIQV